MDGHPFGRLVLVAGISSWTQHSRLSSGQTGGMGSVCQLALPVKRALNGSAGAGLAGFCRAPPRACMVDRLAPFNRSTWPFPRRSEAPVAGLTRAVLNRGSVCGLGSGSSVVSACGGGTATGSVLSLVLSGAAGSIDRASCLTFAGQWSCDLGGMAPVFLNQHLRPSISRQENQPLLESPGALRQSIAHADELPRQQQRQTE